MRADHDDAQRVPRGLAGSARRPTPAPAVAPRDAAAEQVCAEDLALDERLVIAPVTGTFFPAFTDVSTEHPGIVAAGDEIGVLVQTGEKHAITSPFTGRLMGMLAMPGERVRMHQPVAWLTTFDDA
jgi:biotin carboxyl carrier protein